MNTPNFRPIYVTDETLTFPIVGPAGSSQIVLNENPQYCLSAASAEDLLAILRAAYPMYLMTIEQKDPWPGIRRGIFNLQVPWITMVNRGGGLDGADHIYSFNAGQFSDYWASASMAAAGLYRDQAVAWRNAQQDISAGMAYQG